MGAGVQSVIASQIQEKQCRFCPGSETLEQLFTFAWVLEEARELNHVLCGAPPRVSGTGPVVTGNSVPIKQWKSLICFAGRKLDLFQVKAGFIHLCFLQMTWSR